MCHGIVVGADHIQDPRHVIQSIEAQALVIAETIDHQGVVQRVDLGLVLDQLIKRNRGRNLLSRKNLKKTEANPDLVRLAEHNPDERAANEIVTAGVGLVVEIAEHVIKIENAIAEIVHVRDHRPRQRKLCRQKKKTHLCIKTWTMLMTTAI